MGRPRGAGSRAQVRRGEPGLLHPGDALGAGLLRVRRRGRPPRRRAQVRVRPRGPDQHPRPPVPVLAAALEEPGLPGGPRPHPRPARPRDRRADRGAPLPDELPAQAASSRKRSSPGRGEGAGGRIRRAPHRPLPRREALRRGERASPESSPPGSRSAGTRRSARTGPSVSWRSRAPPGPCAARCRREAPAGRLEGTLRVPASKSVTNRALLAAALAPGRSEVVDPLDSDDTRALAEALVRLGASGLVRGPVRGRSPGRSGPRAGRSSSSTSVPPGRRRGSSSRSSRPCRAGSSSTAARGCGSGRWGPLVEALRSRGARIEAIGEEGFLPLRIEGGALTAGEISDSRRRLFAVRLGAPPRLARRPRRALRPDGRAARSRAPTSS